MYDNFCKSFKLHENFSQRYFIKMRYLSVKSNKFFRSKVTYTKYKEVGQGEIFSIRRKEVGGSDCGV